MVVVIAKNYFKDMGASSAKILTISCGMSRGKLEVQVLDCGGNAALLQKMILLSMILLIFCAFGEIALPCSAVIDSRYNAGNAEVLLGREPTGTLALLSALRPGGLGFRKTGHFCLSKGGDRRRGTGWRR